MKEKWLAKRVKLLVANARIYHPLRQIAQTKLRATYNELVSKNIDVIDMGEAFSYRGAADNVREATKKALYQKKIPMVSDKGDRELLEAIAWKMKTYNKMDVDPDQILVTNACTHANFLFQMATLEEGDEVLHPDPDFSYLQQRVGLFGAKSLGVPLKEEEGNKIIKEDWESMVTPKTKAIYLTNPNNPGGRVFTRKELSVLADIAIENDLLVNVDEVYDQMVFEPHKHISIATLPGMAERTFTLNSFSKIHGMEGWRIGYIISPSIEFNNHLLCILSNSTHAFCSIIQKGAAVAVKDLESVKQYVKEDKILRDGTYKRLLEIDDIRCLEAEGGNTLFPNMSKYFKSSEACNQYLLEEAHVNMEAGIHFGDQGEGHIRLAFGLNPLERNLIAIDRIEAALKKLR